MTAPVAQEPVGEKIAMTAPVTQMQNAGAWVVRFQMPSAYTIEFAAGTERSEGSIAATASGAISRPAISGLASWTDVDAKSASLLAEASTIICARAVR